MLGIAKLRLKVEFETAMNFLTHGHKIIHSLLILLLLVLGIVVFRMQAKTTIAHLPRNS